VLIAADGVPATVGFPEVGEFDAVAVEILVDENPTVPVTISPPRYIRSSRSKSMLISHLDILDPAQALKSDVQFM